MTPTIRTILVPFQASNIMLIVKQDTVKPRIQAALLGSCMIYSSAGQINFSGPLLTENHDFLSTSSQFRWLLLPLAYNYILHFSGLCRTHCMGTLNRFWQHSKNMTVVGLTMYANLWRAAKDVVWANGRFSFLGNLYFFGSSWNHILTARTATTSTQDVLCFMLN